MSKSLITLILITLLILSISHKLVPGGLKLQNNVIQPNHIDAINDQINKLNLHSKDDNLLNSLVSVNTQVVSGIRTIYRFKLLDADDIEKEYEINVYDQSWKKNDAEKQSVEMHVIE